ncbi:hypothetical protein NDU88_010183 [Pleurodeles waltl]|uniref:Uncharacterized protein n=1 Tax=Pleurodeles waltl TaxID=8319 RepID=A0AAV7PUN2_PLEWA|nr:hypothetical protein NDU88_010183 [Pleurodeles waltl]
MAVRGQPLSLIAGVKGKARAQLDSLESKMLYLEARVSHLAEAGLVHQIKLKQQDYRDVAEHKAKTAFLATQRRLYKVGNRSGQLLAWLGKRNCERIGLRRWTLRLASKPQGTVP